MSKENFRSKQKKELKKYIKKAPIQNYKIFKSIQEIIKKQRCKKILLYIPLPYEPNLLLFRRKFCKNCTIFVPFMQDESLKIVKLRLPFGRKKFGIYEPNNSFVNVKIDLAIVPVIGADANFRRIGHGNGFYDRFFANLNYRPLIIFTQSLNGLCKVNLSEKYDIQGDFFINPFKKYYRKIKNAKHNYCTYSRYNRRWDWIFSCQKIQ
ncbi:5-formyltetrahydrofolate cyclo-ligase [Campylobacter sp. US33a]|uniref:5-formyltetrahydrofolate cyclo-ligase n=1 Tax=Campylobacter sp. US33a TaxID=2498120 RepID=UPI0010686DF0|nr:5-formyltetrahydrofolate cyclo-ligase [Campylobacter sp. US33a]TEY03617.1 5-formyltetrahydrofolate cyclo-ligase [Campylobacter sp. US33a]